MRDGIRLAVDIYKPAGMKEPWPAILAYSVTSDWSFFVKMGEMVPNGVPLNPVTANPEVKPEANDTCSGPAPSSL